MFIGNVEIKNNVILAPMAGVTDLPFRLLCKEQGCGMLYSEMVSAKAIMYNNRNTDELLKVRPEENPVAVQLFGSDPQIMADMAKRIEELPFDTIDVNMGCPVPKVVNNGEGSALMKNPLLVGQIVSAMAKAVKKPVTVKIRKGFNDDMINAPEIAHIIEESGGACVAVHGRTREQYYTGKADWDIIRQVKQRVHIPVIGNGDITDALSARAMLDETGCDAVMIGRGTLGNPYLIKQVVRYLEDGVLLKDESPIERMETCLKHFNYLLEIKPEKVATLEMRTHAAWYLKGLPGGVNVKKRLYELKTKEEFISTITEYMENLS